MKEKYLILFLLFLALFAFTISNQSNAIDPKDVVALYTFDSDSGKNITDSAQKNDGKLEGDAQIVAGGKLRNALQIDGEEDYADVGNLGEMPEGTVEAWVNLQTPRSASYSIINFGKSYGSNGDVSSLGTHGSYGANMLFGIYSGGWKWANSGIPADDLYGKWHHLAGTWGKRGIEIWIDGENQATDPFTGVMPAYDTVLIGTGSWKQDAKGMIDSVRIAQKQLEAKDFLLKLPVDTTAKLTTIWGKVKRDGAIAIP